MKAKFIGVPGEDHQSVMMYGQEFRLGESVTLNNETAKRKLANHPHFEVQEEASDKVEEAKIKREFSGAMEAALDPVAEQRAQEEESVRKAQEAERQQGRQPRK